MRYWPVPSVTTERTFSISTGLAASTVTPGRIAPDASLTTPVMAACAQTEAGKTTSETTPATRARSELRMRPPDAGERTDVSGGFYACLTGKSTENNDIERRTRRTRRGKPKIGFLRVLRFLRLISCG